MGRLTQRVTTMQEAATLKMARLGRELRATGVDVISLAVGEPDFDTPDFIKDAANRALAAGHTKYTPVPGIAPLREAIAEKFRAENALDYEPGQIVVSTGAKQSLMNVCLALLEEGDEAIFLAPYWVSYFEMARFAGATPVVVSADIEQDYKISADELEAAITPRTRLIMINSPCNPSGSMYTRSELEAFAKVILAHDDLYVVSDEIYEYITFGEPHVSLGTIAGMADRVITVNGFSKGFAMTGWRLGYLGAPAWIAGAVGKIQGQFTSGANAFAQHAAVDALRGDRGASRDMCTAYQRRRDLLCALLGDIKGVQTNRPAGAFYVFPNVTEFYGRRFNNKVIDGSVDLCELLLSEAHVALVPGAAFGDDRSIRFSGAAADDVLTEGVRRVAAVLERLES
ncbi:MAG: pyridoxal phosphate-dependent aminotransferase [Gammaproteobacteria bacterium]